MIARVLQEIWSPKVCCKRSSDDVMEYHVDARDIYLFYSFIYLHPHKL
jgi:hypothetical protein